jgi:hypothetical protein
MFATRLAAVLTGGVATPGDPSAAAPTDVAPPAGTVAPCDAGSMAANAAPAITSDAGAPPAQPATQPDPQSLIQPATQPASQPLLQPVTQPPSVAATALPRDLVATRARTAGAPHHATPARPVAADPSAPQPSVTAVIVVPPVIPQPSPSTAPTSGPPVGQDSIQTVSTTTRAPRTSAAAAPASGPEQDRVAVALNGDGSPQAAPTTDAQPLAPSDAIPQIVAPPVAGGTSHPAGPIGTAAVTPASAPHPPAVQQIAPALVAVGGSPGGPQHVAVRLQPPDLGTVQIRIDRPADAPAHVTISVTRPDTLTMLVRDQTQLQHMLDQAGVPAAGRTLEFQLVGQDPGASSGQPGQTFQGGSGEPRGTAASAAAPDDAPEPTLTIPAAPLWRRAGIDITA